MKKFLLLACMLLVCSIGVVGCGGKDETQNPAAPGGDKMGAPSAPGGNKMAAPGSGDAVKDKVVGAIMADDTLKSAGITVEHKDGKVILKGMVADNATKKKAAEVTTKAITDAGSTDKVQNMLQAKTH